MIETEFTIYCKIGDPTKLNRANSVEKHEQAEMRLQEGRCRVRKTEVGGQVKYEMTMKTPTEMNNNDVRSNKEETVPVTEPFFNTFKANCETSQIKTRYKFSNRQIIIKQNDEEKVISVPEMCYEVDVFTRMDGEQSEWCKIDVELHDLQRFLKINYPDVKEISILRLMLSHLPFKPSEFMTNKTNPDVIKRLFYSEFNIPNGSQ